MKTTKLTLLVMVFTLTAFIPENSAEAQERRKHNYNDSRVKRYKELRHKETRDEGHDWDYKYKVHPNRDKNRQHANRSYQKQHDKHNYYSGHNNHNRYKHHKNYPHNKNLCYRHPHHGMVYRKFHKAPIEFRHHNCHYYYIDGYYYRHQDGVGFIRVELPGNIIIERLPERCERFSHHGHVYFRTGDLVFESYGHGFRMLPDFNIQILARF